MLIDLIIGVICKILDSLFTFVNLQIACKDYLFLTSQTTDALYTGRYIFYVYTHGTYWCGRKKKKNRH